MSDVATRQLAWHAGTAQRQDGYGIESLATRMPEPGGLGLQVLFAVVPEHEGGRAVGLVLGPALPREDVSQQRLQELGLVGKV